MQDRNVVIGVVALFGLLAVVMAVVSVKLSPLDRNDAAFVVEAAELRAARSDAVTAPVYFVLTNRTGRDDRLTAAAGDATLQARNGAPIDLPDGASHVFAPGGDHLVVSGLTAPLEPSQIIPVTLLFETAGAVTIEVPVRLSD